MPAGGGMRRTRVFGLVKPADGARVLRSGRRLWPESGEGKPRKAGADTDEWLAKNINAKNSKNYPNNGAPLKGKETGWAHEAKTKQEARTDIKRPEFPKRVLRSTSRNLVDKERRMFGAVYTRKRKRAVDGVERPDLSGNKKFEIQFSCRQRSNTGGFGGFGRCLYLIVESSSSGSAFGQLLLSVLMYMKRVGLRLSALVAFLLSEPICSAFGSSGILFSWDPFMKNTGVCRLFGVFQFVPLFCVNYSAIPYCFTYMHLSLVFRVRYLSFVPVNNSLDEDDDFPSDGEVDSSCFLIKSETTGSKAMLKEAASPRKKAVHPSVRASKLVRRSYQLRSSLNSHGIRKRRSSLRQRRAVNPSLVSLQKSSGVIVVGLACSRQKVDSLPTVISKKNGASLPSVITENKHQSSVITCLAAQLTRSSLTMVKPVWDTSKHLSGCSANLLVVEADQCHRIEGVSIILEKSDSREWVLSVKKDGRTLYNYLAQKCMSPPCTFDRITHDVIWSADETWKLEFPSRHGWSVFKDLYKECCDHNVPASITRVIPVPGVHEVRECEDSTSSPFSRPDTYITVNSDEVARALAKKSANYDIDSEDEEWLKNFDNGPFWENDYGSLPDDKFELMFDIFEKSIYCSPDDFAVAKAVYLCEELGRKEIIEAVYGYWMKKRERKRSALLKVFQVHQPKRAPVIPTAVLRKKRSFKRQPSQCGRGKQPSLFQAMAAEQAVEEQNAMLKVEETKESARRTEESAIAKRKRAQLLMENADLAIYRAVTALRIAEAACFTDVADVAVTQIID